MKKYDIVYIGSGHAAWHGALILKMMGKKIAIVDRDLIGGTCTNYGCDAKILLDAPFELKEALERYQGKGLKTSAEIDWTELMAYKKDIIGAFPPVMENLFKMLKFDVIHGEAKFVDNHTLDVDGERIYGKKIVICTGQTYVVPDIPGKEYFSGSREFLSMDEIPERVTCVGAGIISMEIATICLSLGREVTIVEQFGNALNAYPQNYVAKVIEKMEAMGAKFIFNATIEELVKNADGSLTLKGKDGLEVTSDYVLCAAGRRANVDNLNLEAAGVEYSANGVKVNDHLQTTCKNIYASGDVVDKKIPKLTPTAEFESNYLAMELGLPKAPAIKYPKVPNVVFTIPRIGQVGVSVAEAQANPKKYRIAEVPFGAAMSWTNKNDVDASLTFIYTKPTNRLVGFACMGDDAGIYTDILTLIMNNKIGPMKLLLGNIWAFPTPTYGLYLMVAGMYASFAMELPGLDKIVNLLPLPEDMKKMATQPMGETIAMMFPH